MKLVFVFLLTALTSGAQDLEIRSLTQPAPLAAVWRYRAAPDSAWAALKLPGAGPQQHSPRATYELAVRLPDPLPPEPLALLVAPICYAYEVSADGRRLGTYGDPQASGGWGQYVPKYAVFPLPRAQGRLQIAIRCSDKALAAASFVPDFRGPSWIGSVEAIEGKKRQLEAERARASIPLLMMIGAAFFAGVLFLITPLWRRDAPEYGWFGAFLVLVSAVRIVQWGSWTVSGPQMVMATGISSILTAIYTLCWRRLFPILFRLPLRPRARLAFLFAWIPMAVFWCGLLVAYEWTAPHVVTFSFLMIGGLGIVYGDVGFRASPEPETPVIHAAVGVYLIATGFFYVVQAQRLLGQRISESILALQAWSPEVRSAALLLFALAMAIALNQRSRRLQNEVATAAQVQSLLLSASRVQGVEAAYWPANEVGGDFYQALETPEGILLLTGDVSGKGLPAAMLVAAILGAFRNRRSNQPAAVLGELNAVLAGGAGFTTCCCALFPPKGEVILANAGNPPPYVDGVEVELPGGLPLGVLREAEFEQSAVAGGWFTFVSDGVIEAANSQGELLGFERTRELSRKPAAEIADAAKQWGQNDDITVVTVRRTV